MDIYESRGALSAGKTIYDLPLRVTFYARVSTDKDEQLHSLSAQVRYFSDFIRACPNWEFVDGYVDEGISGTSADRRESFLRMIGDARRGRFDFIVTKEISRFSRNTLDSIRYTQELLGCGVGVYFQADNINTLMPDAELRLTIMSSIAQDEVRKISERVKFGFRRAIERGTVLGNSKIWGYRKQDGRLVVDEGEAELVRLIFELYANRRMGIRAIAAHLEERGYRNTNGNGFSFSTLRGILSNPKYKGFYCGGKSSKVDYKLKTVKAFPREEWVMYQDEERVPPIVSQALWEKANRLLASRSAKQSAADRTSYQNKYPYSGKIFCSVHQTPYYRALYRGGSGAREVWQCREYARKGRQGCPSPVLYTSELDEIMRRVLEELPIGREGLLTALLELYTQAGAEGRTGGEIAKCRAEVEELLRRKDKLLDLSVGGRISDGEFEARNQRFNQALEETRRRLQALEEDQERTRAALGAPETLRRAAEEELRFEAGFSVGVMDALLERAEVARGAEEGAVLVTVRLRTSREPQTYALERRRGRASVCTRQYT